MVIDNTCRAHYRRTMKLYLNVIPRFVLYCVDAHDAARPLHDKEKSTMGVSSLRTKITKRGKYLIAEDCNARVGEARAEPELRKIGRHPHTNQNLNEHDTALEGNRPPPFEGMQSWPIFNYEHPS